MYKNILLFAALLVVAGQCFAQEVQPFAVDSALVDPISNTGKGTGTSTSTVKVKVGVKVNLRQGKAATQKNVYYLGGHASANDAGDVFGGTDIELVFPFRLALNATSDWGRDENIYGFFIGYQFLSKPVAISVSAGGRMHDLKFAPAAFASLRIPVSKSISFRLFGGAESVERFVPPTSRFEQQLNEEGDLEWTHIFIPGGFDRKAEFFGAVGLSLNF